VSLSLGGGTAAAKRGSITARLQTPTHWAEATPTPPSTDTTRRPLNLVAAEIEVRERSRSSLVLKRTIDVVGSVIGLVLLSPLLLAIALTVRLTSRGPSLFVQERCGLRGHVFRFYKFRTMVADAEDRKSELQHLNEMKGPVFKIRRDPRITRLGALLRKTSLDELPQLWNVLRGDMSLVGPRPPLPEEVEHYDARQVQRLSVIPGLTGLWQVSGRSALADFDKWIDLDLQYAHSWSLWLDLRIIAKTVVVVILARGAQ
jgi:exopolysaccharide biosynthesis polyprenyl glycosylphosphotransferase